MRVFEVEQITNYVADLFRTDEVLSDLWLRGEVGDFKRAASGHIYFSLLGQGALLRCVLFRGAAARNATLPAQGEAVVLHGALGFYDARGTCEMIVDQVYPEGLGLARIQFEALKRKLDEEGLFDPSRKRALPPFPRAIGVVSSESGAVIHDILSVLARRYPLAEIVFAPASVQGEQAPRELVAALGRLNRYALRAHLDLIVVARGGGSEGELSCFNDEAVVRAAFGSRVPIVSAIGHETDFTLLDFVADLRAPTPSAAAELIVPDMAVLRRELEQAALSLADSARQRLRLDRAEVQAAQARLLLRSPLAETARQRVQTASALDRGARALRHRLELARRDASTAEARLQALNPLRTLRRGYSLVSGPSGALVTSHVEVSAGDTLTVRVLDGQIDALVGGTRARPSSPQRPTQQEQHDAAPAHV